MGLGIEIRPIYLTIGDGKIIQTFKNPTDGAIERKNKNDKIVYEKKFDHITGYLVKCSVTEHPDYGKFWNILIKDDESEQLYMLQIGLTSAYATSFLKAIPNADLRKPITFKPYMKVEDDKKKVTMFLTQKGQALKHYYTKDSPHGMPGPIQVRDRQTGKMVWDYYDQTDFLVQAYENKIAPLLAGLRSVSPEQHKATEDIAKENVENAGSDIADDLPF